MNITIDRDDDLWRLDDTKCSSISRNTLTLDEELDQYSKEKWDKDFFNFEEISNFPFAEELRKSLVNPKEDPLFGK